MTNKIHHLIFVTSICIITLSTMHISAYQQIFISTNGSDTNSGLSAEDALESFSAAVTTANTYSVEGAEIIVGPGKYYEGYSDPSNTVHVTTNKTVIIWKLADNISIKGSGSGTNSSASQIIHGLEPLSTGDGSFDQNFVLLLQPGNNSRIQDISFISSAHPGSSVTNGFGGGVLCVGSWSGFDFIHNDYTISFPPLTNSRTVHMKNVYLDSDDVGIGFGGGHQAHKLTFNCIDLIVNVGIDGIINYSKNSRINLIDSLVNVRGEHPDSNHDDRTIGLTTINASAEIFAYNSKVISHESLKPSKSAYNYAAGADKGLIRAHGCVFYTSESTNSIHFFKDTGDIEYDNCEFFEIDSNSTYYASDMTTNLPVTEVRKVHVLSSAKGSYTGVNWENAYTNIHDALAAIDTITAPAGVTIQLQKGDLITLSSDITLPDKVSLSCSNQINVASLTNVSSASPYQFVIKPSDFSVIENLNILTENIGNIMIGSAPPAYCSMIINNCLVSSDDTTIGLAGGHPEGSMLLINDSLIRSSLNGLATYSSGLDIIISNTDIISDGDEPSYPGYSSGLFASDAFIYLYGSSQSTSSISVGNSPLVTYSSINGPLYSQRAKIYIENYELDSAGMADNSNFTMRSSGADACIFHRGLTLSSSSITSTTWTVEMELEDLN